MQLNKELWPVTPVSRGDRPIHVLEVIGNAGFGGMESYIKNFIAHLPANQFRVTCICPNESLFTASLRQLGVEDVFITPIEDDPVWRSIQLTAEVSRLHQIDLLHSHMPKAHVLAGIAGRLIDKPVVAAVHGMNVTSHELGITRAVGSYLITNCQEAFTQALAMGVSAERVNLVRNGVDINTFSPARSGVGFRAMIGVEQNIPLVGFVGRLEHEKGPDLFLRAADYVHHRRPDVHFAVIGDGLMRNQLQDMCAHMRLENHVHFTGWQNTVDVYPALDLLAHTSRSDGTSLVLLEAMACACPTVGIAVGGVPEIIENENTGFVAGPGDWEGIAFRIIQLLDQPERLKGMGAAARDRVEKHFNLQANTVKTADLLRQIAGAGINGHRYANNPSLTPELGGRASLDSMKG